MHGMALELTLATAPTQVRHLMIFKGLPALEIRRAQSLVLPHSLKGGELLLTIGKVSGFVYFVLSGTICINRSQYNGARTILNMVGAGEVLGEICACDKLGHSANALATEPTSMLKMRRADFQKLEADSHTLSRNVKWLLAHRLRFATTLNEALAERRVCVRITLLLGALADRYSKDSAQQEVALPLRLTQSEIAEWACVSRQHAEKHIVLLRSEGILRVDAGRRMVIQDRHRLSTFCEQIQT